MGRLWSNYGATMERKWPPKASAGEPRFGHVKLLTGGPKLFAGTRLETCRVWRQRLWQHGGARCRAGVLGARGAAVTLRLWSHYGEIMERLRMDCAMEVGSGPTTSSWSTR